MFETIFNNDNKNYQWRTTVIFSVSGYKKPITKAVFSMQILREKTGTLLSIYFCAQDFNCIKCNKTTDICLIQPTISLEMPVPSQGHYGFHSFPVVD